jgi:hypothetical protein
MPGNWLRGEMMRTRSTQVTFHNPFNLDGVEGNFPPGTYKIEVGQEKIEVGPVQDWKQLSVSVCTPAIERAAGSEEWIVIKPEALQAALAFEEAAETASSAGAQ